MTNSAVMVLMFAVVTLALVIGVMLARRQTREVAADPAQLASLRQTWREPPDLASRSVPRDVRYTGTAYALFAVAAAVSLGSIVGVILLYPRMRRTADENALVAREGVAAHGTITSRSEHHGKSTSYRVVYEYDAGGARQHGSASVGRAEYAHLTVGAWVPIHYASSRPEVSRVDDGDYGSPWLPFMMLIPALILFILPTVVRDQKRLLVQGTPTVALVIRVAPTKGGKSIRYQFLSTAGDAIVGNDTSPSKDAPKVGDAVTVLFDPERPRRNARYPLGMVRIAD